MKRFSHFIVCFVVVFEYSMKTLRPWQFSLQDDDRPTSNPLPPQSEAFASYTGAPPVSAKEVLETMSQQIPNFGTEQVCLLKTLCFFVIVMVTISNTYVDCLNASCLCRIKQIVPFTSRQVLVVLVHNVAEFIFILISPVHCSSRTCITVQVLLGSKMRGLRSVKWCSHVTNAYPTKILLYLETFPCAILCILFLHPAFLNYQIYTGITCLFFIFLIPYL